MSEWDFSTVRNNTELADMLKLLKQGLEQARTSSAIDADTEASVQSSLNQAIREAHMPAPNKTALLDHLDNAKESLSDCTTVQNITAALTQAEETVQRLF